MQLEGRHTRGSDKQTMTLMIPNAEVGRIIGKYATLGIHVHDNGLTRVTILLYVCTCTCICQFLVLMLVWGPIYPDSHQNLHVCNHILRPSTIICY